MPRKVREWNYEIPAKGATNQDIVDAVESNESNLTAKLEELDLRLERIDREQELILGEEMEEV